MLDCLVLGSGRSGTSLVAGMLDRAGYYTGDNYLVGRLANPRGFFEDSRVNSINDALLKAGRLAGRLTDSLVASFSRGLAVDDEPVRPPRQIR